MDRIKSSFRPRHQVKARKIEDLRRKGHSIREIAAQLNIASPNTVMYYLKRGAGTGKYATRKDLLSRIAELEKELARYKRGTLLGAKRARTTRLKNEKAHRELMQRLSTKKPPA